MFMVLGIITLVPTIATIILLPDFLVRFLFVLLTRLCYRIKIVDIENLPTDRALYWSAIMFRGWMRCLWGQLSSGESALLWKSVFITSGG